MAQKKLRTPSSVGGLVRYEEESASLVKLQPKHVLVLIGGLLILEIFLMFIPV